MHIILTAIGKDRPGLTQALADAIGEAGGNWHESHFAALGGKFVGSVLVELPDARLEDLQGAASKLDGAGFTVSLTPADEGNAGAAERAFCFELTASDRPGIVREVSTAIAALGASIDELETATEDEAWSGGTLFRAKICVAVPEGVSADAVREALEDISGEMMVDFEG
ncbi:MAG: ACT domain-containing protein [Sphingomonadaceae bacterium]